MLTKDNLVAIVSGVCAAAALMIAVHAREPKPVDLRPAFGTHACSVAQEKFLDSVVDEDLLHTSTGKAMLKQCK